jgi:hypothetical protein
MWRGNDETVFGVERRTKLGRKASGRAKENSLFGEREVVVNLH